MQTIITYLLNFYTFSIMLSMVCMALYVLKVKSLLDKMVKKQEKEEENNE